MTGLDRRSFLRFAGALGASGALAACGGGESSKGGGSKTVVLADFGGSAREANKAAYADPFTKETGIRVQYVDADPAKFLLQAKRGRGQWDCYDAAGLEIVDFVGQGVLEKLPPNVPRSDLITPKTYQDYAAGGFAPSMVLAYRQEAFPGGKAPGSWADFWDTRRFPGKRVMPKYNFGAAEAALMADGVRPEAVYPLDLDRAYEKLSEIKADALFAESYAQATQYLVSGNADLALIPNGRVFDARKKGAKLDIQWNQAILYPWESYAIPKGAPHADAMFQYAQWMTDPARQAKYASLTGYGPLVSAAMDLIPAGIKAQLPNSPEHVKIACVVPAEAAAKQNAEYVRSYTTWLGG